MLALVMDKTHMESDLSGNASPTSDIGAIGTAIPRRYGLRRRVAAGQE